MDVDVDMDVDMNVDMSESRGWIERTTVRDVRMHGDRVNCLPIDATVRNGHGERGSAIMLLKD
jgi:hypothetical protein